MKLFIAPGVRMPSTLHLFVGKATTPTVIFPASQLEHSRPARGDTQEGRLVPLLPGDTPWKIKTPDGTIVEKYSPKHKEPGPRPITPYDNSWADQEAKKRAKKKKEK